MSGLHFTSSAKLDAPGLILIKKKTYDASWSLTSVHGRTSVCVTRLGRLVITWSTSVGLDLVVLAALAGADLGAGCRRCAAPPPPRDDLRFSNTTGILQKKKMWFIGVEVEQERSAPPPKKKSWIRPCLVTTCFRFSDSRAFQYTAWHQMFLVWSYRCLHRLPKSASHPMKQQDYFEDGQVSVTCRRYAFDFQPDIKNCQTEFCCSCFGRERLNPPVFQFRILTPLNSEQTWTATERKAC